MSNMEEIFVELESMTQLVYFFGKGQFLSGVFWSEIGVKLDYMGKFVLDVKDGKWIEKDFYFHHLLEYSDHNFNLECSSIVTKSLDL